VPLEVLDTEVGQMAEKIAANSAISLKMIKKGLQMARGEVSLEALMDFEIEACLTCVSTKERQASLEGFEGRQRKS
jgi:enoyl-CoA hydratase